MKHSNDKIIIVLFIVVVVAAFAAIIVLGGQSVKQNDQQNSQQNTTYVVNEPHVKNISVTRVVDSSCSRCFSLNPVVNSLRSSGVNITSDVTADYSSDEGKRLVQEYGITTLPAIVMSKDIDNYTFFSNSLPALNATYKDGNYMLQKLRPPYEDISTGKVLGLVDVIYLNDSSCSLCYDVMLHRRILQGYGVAIVNETLVDANSTQGRAIISKFGVHYVPTFLMSPDAAYYSVLSGDWSVVGKIVDGWYIFANMTAINSAYRNLDNGVIVVPAG